MIFLPPLGFPISFFLVLAGVRFGVWDGMLLTFFILPVHMTICYTVTRCFFRGPLRRFLEGRGYEIPLFQTRRPGLAMLGFLLMPGPPYALKTYLLAMTDMPYLRFLLFNWITESFMTLPIVAMTGAAAEKNWFLFAVALLIFALSLFLRWQKKRKEKAGL
ncbi:MAG: VTT domain-containing protein [Desulfosalsimonas sp.]